MNETEFRQFLKKYGKKAHVIEGLVMQVMQFEAFLSREAARSLDSAGEQDIQDYAASLAPKSRATNMRGPEAYFRFMGRDVPAQVAHDIREQGIAKTRKVFKLRDFRGVSLDAVAKLEAIGIVTVNDMLAAGKTPQSRRELAERADVAPEIVLELVKLSDLTRVGAVKAVRARLYYDAGLDTPHKFTEWEPEALRQMLVEFVERTGFEGIASLPKEIRNAITTAKTLPRLIEYD